MRDEEILLLDLYLRYAPKTENDPHVIALSELLNALPIHALSERASTFRNPTGVFMKLGNLRHLDRKYSGRGLGRANRLALEVWQQYAADLPLLRATAAAIERAAKEEVLAAQLRRPVEGEQHAREGRILFRIHRLRERQPGLVRDKKRQALRHDGRLICEVW